MGGADWGRARAHLSWKRPFCPQRGKPGPNTLQGSDRAPPKAGPNVLPIVHPRLMIPNDLAWPVESQASAQMDFMVLHSQIHLILLNSQLLPVYNLRLTSLGTQMIPNVDSMRLACLFMLVCILTAMQDCTANYAPEISSGNRIPTLRGIVPLLDQSKSVATQHLLMHNPCHLMMKSVQTTDMLVWPTGTARAGIVVMAEY